MGVIDAHHHFWRVDRQPQAWRTGDHDAIARDFEPADLAGELAAAGVRGTVLVQSVDLPEENDRLLAYAHRTPYVRGVVAWAPLHDAERARRVLAGLYGRAPVCGVRCLIGRDDAGWLTAPDTLALFQELAAHGLTWDVVPVTAAQTRQVRAVAAAVPELRIVVDHLARPPLDGGAWRPWADRITALAGLPNTAVKLSVGIDVLTSLAGWSGEALLRPVGHALACFGAERAMLASNWPVVTLRRSYRGAWADLDGAVARAVAGCPAALVAVRGQSAARWYGLPS